MVAAAGGADIRCVPYVTYGTQKLSDLTIKALENRHACLLANHGMLCYAKDLATILDLSVEVEALARVYVQALQDGEPVLMGEHQMAEVLERFIDCKAGVE